MLGDRIRGERERRGWSQEFLARKSGIDRRLISKIETGGVVNTRWHVALALTKALGISLESMGV